MSLTRIESYEALYAANQFAPRIWLKNGTSHIGQLVFNPNGQSLPADGPGANNPSLHYHLDDFHNALDMLRNEKPLWLLYSGTGGGFENGIKTETETTGEGETGLKRFATR